MKKQFLVLAMLVTTFPAHAIYNLYKKDGLSLDMNGEVNLYLEKDSVNGENTLINLNQQITDERVRLFPDSGASWLDFRISQQLPNDWRATGTLGMGYAQGNGGSFLNSANVSLDKLNVGAITLGRQYLHTGFVTRTGTYSPLDVFGEQAVRLDYYGLDNVHASAYYLLPSSTDVRRASNSTKTEGFGVSGSYMIPFADNHNLRLAGGYSNSKANPRNLNAYSPNADGYAVSAEYRVGKFLGAVDYGRKDIELGGNLIAKSKSDNVGVKVGYEISPRLNLMAGYGVRKYDTTYQNGVTTPTIYGAILNELNSGGFLASVGAGFLYDDLQEKMTFVRGDYYLRDNVRLYGQVQKQELEGKVQTNTVSKMDDTAYRVGVALSF